MDVILHIGAHRCATTTFQSYMRANSVTLTERGIGFWGPWRTRDGLFRGLQPGPLVPTGRDHHRRALGRIRLRCAKSRSDGVRHLVISDENMAGTMRENMRLGALYSGIGERMARYAEAFDGQIGKVVLNIRCLERFWSSTFGYGIMRGNGVARPGLLRRVTESPRSWRDVISDVACAIPGVQITVLPFETYAGRPEAQLAIATGADTPLRHARIWLNQTPHLPVLREHAGPDAVLLPQGTGRWRPFDPQQVAALRERYADDLLWLAAGADGLAMLAQDPTKTEAAQSPPFADMTRGSSHDSQERRMARAR
ncbi:hypothetical protein CFI11_16720 [Thalassococcus sp. S3]|nr:hypothetical protein CFI11_16720 [Thalassococcus sp. S3]